MDRPDWPRGPIPPCPPGLSLEETEQAMLAMCQPLWDAEKIPVIATSTEPSCIPPHGNDAYESSLI